MSSVDSAKMLIKPLMIAEKDTSIAPSLFKNHLLSVKNIAPEIHTNKNDFVIAGILLVLYIVFVWLYVYNYKRMSQIIRGFYISRNSNQKSRDEISIGNRVSVSLSVFFIVTLTLFFSRILSYYDVQFFEINSSFWGIVIALALIIAYSVKFATIKLLGYLFNIQREVKEYMVMVFLFCNTLGLFMLPIVICLTFIKQISPIVFIYTGIGVIAIFFSVRIIRSLIFGLKSMAFSKLYLFMYLCIFEIVPIVIIVKLFMLNLK